MKTVTLLQDMGSFKAGDKRSLNNFAANSLIRNGKATDGSEKAPKKKAETPPETKPEVPPQKKAPKKK